MSSFQALATAIAAQVGTGNIAGCAAALVSGGPGAVFWKWVSAFFGMATIYGEAVLALSGLVAKFSKDDNFRRQDHTPDSALRIGCVFIVRSVSLCVCCLLAC